LDKNRLISLFSSSLLVFSKWQKNQTNWIGSRPLGAAPPLVRLPGQRPPAQAWRRVRRRVPGRSKPMAMGELSGLPTLIAGILLFSRSPSDLYLSEGQIHRPRQPETGADEWGSVRCFNPPGWAGAAEGHQPSVQDFIMSRGCGFANSSREDGPEDGP